jgi:hypothetical protein
MALAGDLPLPQTVERAARRALDDLGALKLGTLPHRNGQSAQIGIDLRSDLLARE